MLKMTIPSHESFRSGKLKFWPWSRSNSLITPSTNDNEAIAQVFESLEKIEGSHNMIRESDIDVITISVCKKGSHTVILCVTKNRNSMVLPPLLV
jgi:hypothetical protein